MFYFCIQLREISIQWKLSVTLTTLDLGQSKGVLLKQGALISGWFFFILFM